MNSNSTHVDAGAPGGSSDASTGRTLDRQAGRWAIERRAVVLGVMSGAIAALADRLAPTAGESGVRATLALPLLGVVMGVLGPTRPIAGPPAGSNPVSRFESSGLLFGFSSAAISLCVTASVIGIARVVAEPGRTLPLLLWPVVMCPLSAVPMAMLGRAGLHRLVALIAAGRLVTLSALALPRASEGLAVVGMSASIPVMIVLTLGEARRWRLPMGSLVLASATGTAVSAGTQAADPSPGLPFLVAGLAPLGVFLFGRLLVGMLPRSEGVLAFAGVSILLAALWLGFR